MRITLPLPPRELSPNVRAHWAKKGRAVQSYRLRALIAGRNATKTSLNWARAHVRVLFCLPDARRRDPDNLMAALKAAWDGLVDARVLADDNGLIIHPPTLIVDRARPRVEIDITEAVA